MKLLSPAISSIARSRLWRIEAWKNNPLDAQREVLQELVTSAQYTEFGRKYNFSNLFNVRDFKDTVPIHEYDDLKPYIERMMQGEQNILWNTPIYWFAKSSGTTSDKSKFILEFALSSHRLFLSNFLEESIRKQILVVGVIVNHGELAH